MEVWTLSFLDTDLNLFEVGVYSSYKLAIKAMQQNCIICGFHNLDDISEQPQDNTSCWCDEGRYIITYHVLEDMPE